MSYGNIETIKKTILYWKRKLEELGRRSAVYIVTKEDDRFMALLDRFLPFFMKEKGYVGLCVISDKQSLLNKISKSVTTPVKYEVIEKEKIDSILRIENAFGFFDRIYTDLSEPFEDANYYNLMGYSGINLEAIVAFVILRMKKVPNEDDICEGYKWLEEVSLYKSELNSLRSLTGRYERCIDRNLAECQKEIIKNKINLKEKRIYLYGNSKYAKICIDAYNDYNLVGVIDRNPKGNACNNSIKMYGLEQVSRLNKQDIVLITNRRNEEIIVQLLKNKKELNKDFFVINLTPDIQDWDNNELVTYIERILRKGEEIYETLRKKYKKEKLILNPWGTSGDIYVAALYLPQYIQSKCQDGYKLFTTSGSSKKVAQLFGYEAEELSQQEMKDLMAYVRVIGFEKLNIKNINISVPNGVRGQRCMNLYKKADFNTYTQRVTFGEKEKKTKPNLKQVNADSVFEKHKLRKGKTILISPYSNTLGQIPTIYANRIVSALKQLGYDVCTNVAGGEKALQGTIGVFLPYDMVVDFANKAAGIIGIRSGLMDILSSTESKMVVIYPKNYYEYFGLKNMSLKTENILELNDEDNSWDDITDMAIEYLSKV